jgi:hypothetical protein
MHQIMNYIYTCQYHFAKEEIQIKTVKKFIYNKNKIIYINKQYNVQK